MLSSSGLASASSSIRFLASRKSSKSSDSPPFINPAIDRLITTFRVRRSFLTATVFALLVSPQAVHASNGQSELDRLHVLQSENTLTTIASPDNTETGSNRPSLSIVPPGITPGANTAPALHLLNTSLLSAISIDNFEKVNDALLRGAQPSDDNLRVLAKSGVRTILDLRMNGEGADHERDMAKKLGVEYLHIPLSFTAPQESDMVKALSTLVNPERQPVFVHCRQGADRTGMVVGMYRRLVDAWDFDSTYIEMRKHHFKPFLLWMRKAVQECPQNSALTKAVRTSMLETVDGRHQRNSDVPQKTSDTSFADGKEEG